MFKSYLLPSILTVTSFLGLSSMNAHAADAKDPFARDIKILTNWFEGG